jgi:DNA-binding NarL/FixJ family response regulator
VFQELLTNVARHAQATHVIVALSRTAEEVTLTVHDNGRGIRAEELSHPQSLGLLGMRERASLLGGAVPPARRARGRHDRHVDHPRGIRGPKTKPAMKFLITDDHEVVRQGVRQILAEEFGPATFGEAANAADLLFQVGKEPWDLVLLDINMPGRNGLEALVELNKQRPRLPVLVLSMFPEREYAVRALKAGAASYLTKESLGRELVAAVKKVLAGQRYITPALAELLAADVVRSGSGLPHEALSDREYEVMKLIAVARSVKQIASDLFLGGKTVFTYRARMLEKLGLQSDVEVVRYALQHRLVE